MGTAPGLPGEVVIRVVRQNLPRFAGATRTRWPTGARARPGTRASRSRIDAAGRTAKVRDAGSTLAADVAGCMVRVMEGASFPAPERAPASEIVEVKVSPP